MLLRITEEHGVRDGLQGRLQQAFGFQHLRHVEALHLGQRRGHAIKPRGETSQFVRGTDIDPARKIT